MVEVICHFNIIYLPGLNHLVISRCDFKYDLLTAFDNNTCFWNDAVKLCEVIAVASLYCHCTAFSDDSLESDVLACSKCCLYRCICSYIIESKCEVCISCFTNCPACKVLIFIRCCCEDYIVITIYCEIATCDFSSLAVDSCCYCAETFNIDSNFISWDRFKLYINCHVCNEICCGVSILFEACDELVICTGRIRIPASYTVACCRSCCECEICAGIYACRAPIIAGKCKCAVFTDNTVSYIILNLDELVCCLYCCVFCDCKSENI